MNFNVLGKKALSGILVTIMACSSVVTDGFGRTVHEMVKAEIVTMESDEPLEEGQYYIYFE